MALKKASLTEKTDVEVLMKTKAPKLWEHTYFISKFNHSNLLFFVFFHTTTNTENMKTEMIINFMSLSYHISMEIYGEFVGEYKRK